MAEDPRPAPPGSIAFAAAFAVLAALLLARLGAETRFSAEGDFFAQPRLWPAVGVIGMAAFGAAHLASSLLGPGARPARGELAEAAGWLRALEFLAWFMAYVWAVPVVGYLPASLAFTTALAARLGYRRRAGLLAAAATGLAVVVAFKAFLSVRIPGGAIYEFLPGGLRNFMIVNL